MKKGIDKVKNVCYNMYVNGEQMFAFKKGLKKMKVMDLLKIVMSVCKKEYGKQFDDLCEADKKVVILQYIQELMATDLTLKYVIGETFYKELINA